MERKWIGRTLLLLFCIVLSGFYLYPTLVNLDPKTTKFPIKQKINLGLDLQGGLYMVLGVDFIQVYQEVMDRQGSVLEERLKEENLISQKVRILRQGVPEGDPRVEVQFASSKRQGVYDLIKGEFTSLRLTGEETGKFELGLTRQYRDEIRDNTINQSIEVIRNRIDEFGVTEPTIASQGEDRVIVELPGVRDIERAKRLIGKTAKLEFKLVDDKSMNAGEIVELVTKIEQENKLEFKKEEQKFSDYVKKINELAREKIPDDAMISFESVRGVTGEIVQRVPYLLKAKTEVTGDELQDAAVGFDPETRRPEVDFTFNPRGANLFGELTGANVGARLAIVLDGIVQSAPQIQSRITSRGRITLGQGPMDQVLKEAKDLAIVLRAGALPAQLSFLEQRVVGPSLGQDSIRMGSFSALVGAIAVFLFMLIYYRWSGWIANLSLFLNVSFITAVLIGLEATLTLPGIAGIALTVGFAVDSNVIIYERIREELRAGKSVSGAVESGFQKAFRTIIDANITNAAGALVLLNFGTGPIKGFAVTMLIGIATTLFTAVFVARLMFDFYLNRLEERKATSLSI